MIISKAITRRVLLEEAAKAETDCRRPKKAVTLDADAFAVKARSNTPDAYDSLSAETEIEVDTLKSLGSRRGSNAARICRAFGCTPGELLELQDDEGMRTPPCR
jgi:hypothetical protein